MTVDIEKLLIVAEGASTFVTNREAQEAVVKLLKLQQEVDDLVNTVKNRLKESLQAESLDFVEGDLVKVTTFESGAKYLLIDPQVAPPEVMEVKLDPKAVEVYVEKNHQLPEGVARKERSQSLRITLK